jgi:hydroxymethylglutaryl-CoA reductase
MARSDISGFHKLDIDERLKKIKEFAHLADEDIKVLKTDPFDIHTANKMIENVIGTIELPLAVATNFIINGKDYLIPMAIEESSVVAAASHAAKLARPAGGFWVTSDPPMMIGQVQILGVRDFDYAKSRILAAKDELIAKSMKEGSTLVSLGGGLKDVEVREVDSADGKLLVVHLIVDVRDAMGANAVNTLAEELAADLEELSGGRALLRIVSNLSTRRLVRAKTVWKKEVLEASFDAGTIKGEEVVDGIISAWNFAKADPWRCATHQKGIMNGIDAVVLATGNDWRAVEAGVHSYCRLKSEPVTKFSKDQHGNLVGEIEVPIAVGLVGGATKVNPVPQVCLKILGVKTSQELAQIAACVGLANNFGALRALATEGIQKGHMKLHASNIAVTAGAHGELVEMIARRMIQENNVSVTRAKELLKELEPRIKRYSHKLLGQH